MKVNIEIDCTPDEARQFFGLPDVKPMQKAVMDHMQARMTEAAERFSPDAMLRSWMSLVPQTPDQLREMIGTVLPAPERGRFRGRFRPRARVSTAGERCATRVQATPSANRFR